MFPAWLKELNPSTQAQYKVLVKKGKAVKQLMSFAQYVLTHPDERFWQALRNWSGYKFVYGQSAGDEVCPTGIDIRNQRVDLHDTFNDE